MTEPGAQTAGWLNHGGGGGRKARGRPPRQRRRGPWQRSGRLLLTLGLALWLCAAGASTAWGSSRESKLNAIARSYGPSGVASEIARTGKGDTALVIHALKVYDHFKYGTGSHTVAEVYVYGGGRWKHRTRVDFGKDSPPPQLRAHPPHVHLTGATDFFVTMQAADATLASVLSNAGGHWRRVPFQGNGSSSDLVTNATVSGNRIRSVQETCNPSCGSGGAIVTVWTYNRGARAFVPAGTPTGPCQGTVTAGPFHLTATCFHREGAKFTAQGSIRIDGVGIQTQGASTITIDPLAETLSASGSVTVSLGSVPIYSGQLNLSLSGSFSIAKKGKVKIKGLPISGNFQLAPTADGMQITAFAGVAAFTGNLTLLVDNDGTLDLKKARLAIGNLPFKQLVIKSASLTYQNTSDGDEWTGDVKVQLPGSLPSLDATLSILNGRLEDVGGTLSGINKPIGEVVFLQSIGLNLGFIPHFTATGTIALTGGPKLPVVNAAAVGLNAKLEADFGTPVVLTASGNITVAGNVNLADAQAAWTIPDKLTLSGTAGFSLAGASVQFTGSGLVDRKGFGFKGNGYLSLPGHSGVKAFGYISEKGLTSCGEFTAGPLNVLLGFGYRWGDALPSLWFDSCGALAFNTAAASRVAQASSAGVAFHVPSGQRQTLFSATAARGYPAYTLRSPSGAVISSRGASDGAIDHGGYLWLRDPDRHALDVVVARPTPGTWTLTAAVGSPRLSGAGRALSAPPIRIVTRVRRVGRRERLSWRASRIPGQSLAFSELGSRTSAAILTTGRARGSFTFTPTADGSRAARRIQVVVDIGQVPRAMFAGARFTPPAPRRPGAPRHIRLLRRGKRVTVTWGPVRGAARYRVIVSDTNGRRDFFEPGARQRRVTILPVLAPDRMTASVQAISGVGLSSRVGRGRLVLRRPRRHRHR